MPNDPRSSSIASMITRVLTALTLFVVACTIFLVFSRHREGYGLDDIFVGHRFGAPGKLTKPESSPVSPGDVPGLTRLDEEITSLISAVTPAVVSINTNRIINTRQADFLGQSWDSLYRVPGIGSGVIISKEGHVVTNYHVIEHVHEITAVLHDGDVRLLKKIGEDRDADIALLQIQDPRPREYHALPFADSDRVRDGATVFAIGNPFGLRASVTQGIISHRDRRFSDSDPPRFQTSATINPGNSGGPLINVRGEIVGINSAIYAGQENVRVWQGIGLAIAANDVVRSIERIRGGGTGYLGIRAEVQQTADTTKELVLTDVIPGSPADKAGLKPGDVILLFGGQPVTKGFDDLFTRIDRRPTDQPVDIVVRRGDTELTITAVVADRQAMLTQEEKMAERRDLREQIGIEVQNITESQRRRFRGILVRGILVTAVEPGSSAHNQIFPGSIIYEVDGVSVDSVEKFFTIISALKGKRFSLRFSYRGEEAWIANIELPN